MSKAATATPNSLLQAAEWYDRLRDGHAAARVRRDWQRWFNASEEHRCAWQQVQELARGFEPLRNTGQTRHAAEALSIAQERLQARRRSLASIATLCSAGMLGLLGWRGDRLPTDLATWRADYRTATGEQRDLQLADGTRLWLNTASAVDIVFDAQTRLVRLIAGEILVDTARDPARPFLVDTRSGRLRALGTRFNVFSDERAVELAVHEGAVEVRTARSDLTRVVGAGQQLRFDADGLLPATNALPARSDWTRNTLTVADMPLHAVVRELCRYRRGHLGLADDIADLRVFGNFPIRDTDRVLTMLATALPIRVTRPLPWWTRIEAHTAAPAAR